MDQGSILLPFFLCFCADEDDVRTWMFTVAEVGNNFFFFLNEKL